jgi:hypothetical protein
MTNEASYNHSDLLLQDFNIQEVENTYLPISIDPGRKNVFTACISMDGSNRQIRRYSSKEDYRLTGSSKYLKVVKNPKMKIVLK